MRYAFTLIPAALLLVACERSHDLNVDPASDLRVVQFEHPPVGITKTRECSLSEDDIAYDEITEWLTSNRDG